jgi:hypothetical protein
MIIIIIAATLPRIRPFEQSKCKCQDNIKMGVKHRMDRCGLESSG